MIEFYSILNKPLEIVLEVFATVTLEARIERAKVERHRRRFSISRFNNEITSAWTASRIRIRMRMRQIYSLFVCLSARPPLIRYLDLYLFKIVAIRFDSIHAVISSNV